MSQTQRQTHRSRSWLWVPIVVLVWICVFNRPLGAAPKYLSQVKLKRILAQQGFCCGTVGKIQIKPLGTMTCGKLAVQLYSYTWEETHPHGKAIHAAYRILMVTEAQEYLGHYKVEGDPPTMHGRQYLEFPYPESEGNRIQCDSNGPPAEVTLNGEPSIFAK